MVDQRWVGVRYWGLIGGIVGAICLAMYPIAVDPYLHPEKWQSVQREARRDIDQQSVQPGGMRVWSNPFEARPDEKK